MWIFASPTNAGIPAFLRPYRINCVNIKRFFNGDAHLSEGAGRAQAPNYIFQVSDKSIRDALLIGTIRQVEKYHSLSYQRGRVCVQGRAS